jgi:hypothetical protein
MVSDLTLLIYGLLYNSVRSLDYTESNSSMISE